MKEYEVYVPLTHNDGSPVNPEVLVRLRERLLEQFGGLTFFPQRNEGFWTLGGVTYRDEIVIYRVLTSQTRMARKFFRELKEDLKRDLDQEEILIVGNGFWQPIVSTQDWAISEICHGAGNSAPSATLVGRRMLYNGC